MAYTKQTWATGEVITQEKLNHAEEGIEGAYETFKVTFTETDNGSSVTYSCDKTYAEITEAINSHLLVYGVLISVGSGTDEPYVEGFLSCGRNYDGDGRHFTSISASHSSNYLQIFDVVIDSDDSINAMLGTCPITVD